MPNSLHEYGVSKPLSKNEYKKEYSITLNLGIGKTNFYKDGTFSVWGSETKITYNDATKEFLMSVPANSGRYSGLYYTGDNAILKSGKTATISYEVWSDREVTLAFKRQNQTVGQAYGTSNKDGNTNGEVEFRTIQANEWTTVYFTYKNNSNDSIYDYSILAVEDTDKAVNLRIKNPRFEIINANTTVEGDKETATISSKFLNWKYNENYYDDEQEVLNLTTRNGSILNMVAQWENHKFKLPEVYADGFDLKGWVDEDGNPVDPDNPGDIEKDKTFTAEWEDNTSPEVDITVTNTTATTLTTDTTVSDVGAGMRDNLRYEYYIKEYGEPDSKYKKYEQYEQYEEGTPSKYVFKGLKPLTRYTIKVRVIADKEGNVGEDITDGTTRELTGEIYVKSQYWLQNSQNEGTQTIVFDYRNVSEETIYKYIEYRIGDEKEWNKGNSARNVENKTTVYAQLVAEVSGERYILATTTVLVDDKINPSITIKDNTAVENRPDTITVTVNANDKETGLGPSPEFTYSIKASNESTYKDYVSKDRTYTFEGLKYLTTYNIKVTVKDRAGNSSTVSINISTIYRYQIIYDGNGATSGYVPPSTQTKDVPFPIAYNKYERRGYHYCGYWIDKSNNKHYVDGHYVYENLSPDGRAVTLYATWIDDIKPQKPKVVLKHNNNNGQLYDGTWTKDNVFHIITSVDEGSGIDYYQYSTDGGKTWKKLETNWNPTLSNENGQVTYTITYTIDEKFRVRAVDKAGNASDPSDEFNVKIDKKAPTAGTLQLKLNNGSGDAYNGSWANANTQDSWTGNWTNQSVWYNLLNGSDNESGHNSTTYSITGANKTGRTETLTDTGTYKITITTKDNVGNTSTRSYTIRIDKIAPTGQISIKMEKPEEVNNDDYKEEEYSGGISVADAYRLNKGVMSKQSFKFNITYSDTGGSNLKSGNPQYKVSFVNKTNYDSVGNNEIIPSGSGSGSVTNTYKYLNEWRTNDRYFIYLYVKVQDNAGNTSYNKYELYLYNAREKFVALLYNNFLGRNPEFIGFKTWLETIDEVINTGEDENEMIMNFMATLRSKIGTPNYPSNETEVRAFGSMLHLFYGFYDSDEFIGHYNFDESNPNSIRRKSEEEMKEYIIRHFYWGILLKQPDPTGLADNMRAINNWVTENIVNYQYPTRLHALPSETMGIAISMITQNFQTWMNLDLWATYLQKESSIIF